MTGDELPDDSHVLRFIRPNWILDDGKVDGTAFRLKKKKSGIIETGLSVHWLEWFEDLNKSQQLAEVKSLSRFKRTINSRFAELHVDSVKRSISAELDGVRFVHKPTEALGNYRADPSHSEIEGLPPWDSPDGALIGDMIAKCIKAMHSAI